MRISQREHPGGLTPRSPVEPAAAAFLDHLRQQGHRAPGTVQAYCCDLTQFCRFLHTWVRDGAPSLAGLNDEAVTAFAAELRARGMRASTVKRKVAAVRGLGRYLVGLGLLARPPAPPTPAAVQGPVSGAAAPLTAARLAAALDRDPGAGLVETRDRAIVEVLYGGGLRLSELVALNLSAVDLEEGTVRVTSPAGVERVVPVGPHAVRALRRYLPRRAESLIDRQVRDLEAGALFVGVRGRRMHPRSIQRAVGRCLEAAAGADAEGAGGQGAQTGRGPRALRQAFAAHLLAAGADAASVRALLGQEAVPGTDAAAADLEQLRQRYARAHPRA